MVGKQSFHNTRRLLNILKIPSSSFLEVVVSMDAEKVVSRVEWDFLFSLCSCFNSWVKFLYSLSVASIQTKLSHKHRSQVQHFKVSLSYRSLRRNIDVSVSFKPNHAALFLLLTFLVALYWQQTGKVFSSKWNFIGIKHFNSTVLAPGIKLHSGYF